MFLLLDSCVPIEFQTIKYSAWSYLSSSSYYLTFTSADTYHSEIIRVGMGKRYSVVREMKAAREPCLHGACQQFRYQVTYHGRRRIIYFQGA